MQERFAWSTAIFAGGVALRLAWVLYLRSDADVWGHRLHQWLYDRRKRRHEARLARRMAAGRDRYFEELRSIQANAPQPPEPTRLIWTDLAWLAVMSFVLAGYFAPLDH